MDTSRSDGSILEDRPAGEPARLQVAGVHTPILTHVTRKSARGMTVEQALPFLQLRTQVWDDAQQSSRIESVSVVVYDGVPRLVLDLAYDDQSVDAPAVSAEPVRRAHSGVVRPRVRIDQTQSFEREATPRVSEPAPVSRESTRVFSTQSAAQAPAKAVQLPLAVAGLKLSVMEQELLQPKDWVFHLKTSWEKAQPHLRRAGWQAQAWSFRAYRWSRPRALAALAASRALFARGLRATLDYVARKRSRAALTAASSAPHAE